MELIQLVNNVAISSSITYRKALLCLLVFNYRKEAFPMKLKILLSIASIYLAFVGLGLIFAPQRFGVDAVPTAASAALIAYLRLFGSPFPGDFSP